MTTPRATLRLSLGGGSQHRLATLIAAETAIEKGWTVRDTTSWRGGEVIPDLVIEKWNGRKSREVFWVEVVDSHDPVHSWNLKGYDVEDVISVRVANLTLDEVYRAMERAIP